MNTFNGYFRPTGKVGIRNHVVVVANASCASGVVNRIVNIVPEAIPLVHTYGCSIPGEEERWRRTLIGVCTNPNIFAVILIGIGCETDDAREIGEMIHAESGIPVFTQVVQDDGGGEQVITRAAKKAKEFLAEAALQKREAAPIDSLILGTQCGGSDALSGVTANPAIGYVSDWLIENGGTVLLTEVAEMIGTEEILAARAKTPQVAEKIREMIANEEEEVRRYLGVNASRMIARGNIAGGLTTVQEKALGCIKKGGGSTVMDVISYAEPVGKRKGLILMQGPGYDPVSLTGLFASGAQVALYSTGRGNPLGHPVLPCIKVCSNSETYNKVGGDGGDMDLNAGAIVTAGVSPESFGQKCIQYLLEVCNGKQTAPESKGYGGALCVYSAATPL